MCSGNTGKLEVGHHQEVEFCVVVTAQVKGPESQLSRLSSLVEPLPESQSELKLKVRSAGDQPQRSARQYSVFAQLYVPAALSNATLPCAHPQQY